MKKILPVIAILMLVFSIPSKARTAQSFSDKVEDHIKTKHPDWRLHTRQTYRTDTGYVWYIEKSPLQCMIGETASQQVAAKEYEGHKRGYPVGPTAQLEDLGDEAVIWKSGSAGGTIIFRKSHVVVIIIAPAISVAEGLAKEIAGLIP